MQFRLVCFLVLLTALFLSSCTKMIYTHEVIRKIKTKDDLVDEMGNPDTIKKYPAFQEWVYYRDTTSITDVSIVTDSTQNSAVPIIHSKPVSMRETEHDKYVKFLVDTNNKVIGHKNQGVDLSKRVNKNAGETILDILGGTAALILLAGLEYLKYLGEN